MNAVMKWLETMQGEPQQIQVNSATTTYRVAATPGVLTMTRSMLLFKLLMRVQATKDQQAPARFWPENADRAEFKQVQALVAAFATGSVVTACAPILLPCFEAYHACRGAGDM